MGFTCDACGAQPATLFCFTHKQSLCNGCDCRIHAPVRGQPKHERVALTGQRETTQCDICQEDSAVMFCAEDRALICRRCDLMIHTANEFTKVHHRYILSGVVAGLQVLDDPKPVAPGAGAGSTAVPALPFNSPSALQSPANLSSRGSEALLDMSAAGGPSGVTFPSGLGGGSASGSLAGATGNISPFGFGTTPGPTTSGAAASSGDASADGLGNVTLAADLLGMPSLPDNYNVKDVDAAWGDAGLGDLEEWSQYLEVPDLGFLDNLGGNDDGGLFSPDLLPFDTGGTAEGFSESYEEPNVSVRAPDLVASSVPTADSLADSLARTNAAPVARASAAVVTSGSSSALRQQVSQSLPDATSVARGLPQDVLPAAPAQLPAKVTVTSGSTGSLLATATAANVKRARLE